ncbi:14320_t:CDS:1, partial [Gigaspora rosea]
MDDDEQTNSPKVKAKRTKYSSERTNKMILINSIDIDHISDSEYEPSVLQSKSKKQSDLWFKLTRTQD